MCFIQSANTKEGNITKDRTFLGKPQSSTELQQIQVRRLFYSHILELMPLPGNNGEWSIAKNTADMDSSHHHSMELISHVTFSFLSKVTPGKQVS